MDQEDKCVDAFCVRFPSHFFQVSSSSSSSIRYARLSNPLGLTNTGVVPILQNIVATVNLETKLDLKEIALKARNAEYNPKRFAAVIMRIRDPKTTALIFGSGKMVITGEYFFSP